MELSGEARSGLTILAALGLGFAALVGRDISPHRIWNGSDTTQEPTTTTGKSATGTATAKGPHLPMPTKCHNVRPGDPMDTVQTQSYADTIAQGVKRETGEVVYVDPRSVRLLLADCTQAESGNPNSGVGATGSVPGVGERCSFVGEQAIGFSQTMRFACDK